MQSPVGVIHSAVENHFPARIASLSRSELTEQGNGIVIKLPPTNRIDIAEQIGYLRLPTPPHVFRQCHALFVQCIRIDFILRNWELLIPVEPCIRSVSFVLLR